MTEIYLIRHGETEWNKTERFRGLSDISLNTKGKKQAESVGRALSQSAFEVIYTSPMRRSVETAQLIAGSRKGIKVVEVQALKDLDCGQWEGMSLEEVASKHPELYNLWETQPHKVRIPGGESLAMVKTRAMDAIREMVELHEGSLVVVTHRVVTKIILMATLGIPLAHFWQLQQDNACINRIRFREPLAPGLVISVNLTAHLEKTSDS